MDPTYFLQNIVLESIQRLIVIQQKTIEIEARLLPLASLRQRQEDIITKLEQLSATVESLQTTTNIIQNSVNGVQSSINALSFTIRDNLVGAPGRQTPDDVHDGHSSESEIEPDGP